MFDWVNVILVSLSMSVDAMCVNAANAVSDNTIKKRKLFLAALLFGLFQFLMPTLGYFIGYSFKDYVEKWIPWIAFTLLFLLGIKSLIDGIKDLKKKDEEVEVKKLSFFSLIVEAIATSIDAFCIGFVFMEESIGNAMLIFGIIGVTTLILSFLTGLFGKIIGKKLQKFAPFISAVIFIGIGIKILLEGIL